MNDKQTLKSLIALALGTFGVGMSEFVIMGILPAVAKSMDVSIPKAGHFISIYAIGVIFGAVCVALFSKRQPLKRILFTLIAVYTVGNLLTVFMTDYLSMNIARFISGIPHGTFFGVGLVAVKQIANPQYLGRSAAFITSGLTIANLLGVPLATFLNNYISWRIIYLSIGLLGFLILYALIKWLPPLEPMPYTNFKGQFQFLKKLHPWLLFGAIFMGNSGFFCELSYINPLLIHVSGFSPNHVPMLMLLSGLGMFFGNYFSGKMTDKYSPINVSEYMQLTASVLLLLFFFFAHLPVVTTILVFACSFCLLSLSAPQQILVLENARGGELLGSSLAPLAFTLGNAIGAFAGGIPVEYFHVGYEYINLPGIFFCFLGFLLLFIFKAITFEPYIITPSN